MNVEVNGLKDGDIARLEKSRQKVEEEMEKNRLEGLIVSWYCTNCYEYEMIYWYVISVISSFVGLLKKINT